MKTYTDKNNNEWLKVGKNWHLNAKGSYYFKRYFDTPKKDMIGKSFYFNCFINEYFKNN